MFAVGILVAVFAFPELAAAKIPFLGPIIPSDFNECPIGFSGLIVVMNRLISLVLTVLIVFVAPLLLAWAGFLLVINAARPEGKEEARKMMLNVVIGIAVALSSYLIVNAVLVALTRPSGGESGTLAYWTRVFGGGGGDPCLHFEGAPRPSPPTGAPTAPTEPARPSGPSTTNNGFTVAPECGDSHARNVQTLVAAGVRGKSSGSCCDKNNSACTSLEGMRAETINQVINVQQACGGVTVSGGTETGHASTGGYDHQSGYKVDLIFSFSCVINRTTAAGTRSDGASLYKDTCGNTYALEAKPHFDVTVLRACSL